MVVLGSASGPNKRTGAASPARGPDRSRSRSQQVSPERRLEIRPLQRNRVTRDGQAENGDRWRLALSGQKDTQFVVHLAVAGIELNERAQSGRRLFSSPCGSAAPGAMSRRVGPAKLVPELLDCRATSADAGDSQQMCTRPTRARSLPNSGAAPRGLVFGDPAYRGHVGARCAVSQSEPS